MHVLESAFISLLEFNSSLLFSIRVVATKFITKLDQRYEKDRKARTFKCKKRIQGSASSLTAMKSPEWAIKANYEPPEDTSLPTADDDEEQMSDVEEQSDESDIFEDNWED